MKAKVGTVLERSIFRQLKKRAAEENRAMSDIIAEALTTYLRASPPSIDERRAAARRLCSRPFNLTGGELEEIIEEDYYNQ